MSVEQSCARKCSATADNEVQCTAKWCQQVKALQRLVEYAELCAVDCDLPGVVQSLKRSAEMLRLELEACGEDDRPCNPPPNERPVRDQL